MPHQFSALYYMAVQYFMLYGSAVDHILWQSIKCNKLYDSAMYYILGQCSGLYSMVVRWIIFYGGGVHYIL